jgi:dipeptidyl aminopeptidase/acylaminoacyl peptidase
MKTVSFILLESECEVFVTFFKGSEQRLASYGSWKSPITGELYASSYTGIDELAVDRSQIYWKEYRPKEGGRNLVMRQLSDDTVEEATPREFNVRTTVHEYGGGDYVVHNGIIYFSDFKDQRLYVQRAGQHPDPITPAGRDLRYADGVVDAKRNRLIMIREDHTVGTSQVTNTIVSVDLTERGPGDILVSGNDFYSTPRLNPENSHLAWLTWNHPNMPWDGTELWVGKLGADGFINEKELVAGGVEESIFQPEWSPDGTLYFASDATGWWNLYKTTNSTIKPLHPMEAEFGAPQWVFRKRTYGFESSNSVICRYTFSGASHLARLNTTSGNLEAIPSSYTDIFDVFVTPDYALFLGGSPTTSPSLVRMNLKALETRVLRKGRQDDIDPGYISSPEAIEFPTERGRTAHAFYYPPKNKDYIAPTDERPPLIVMSHGGPTSSTATVLRYGIQYWTSRGISVVDVNYGGSTGYGREYRKRLEGNWGVVDVDDCVNAARYLAARGDVDGKRLAITGGSAGGYTTLCALTFRDFFHTGASYYGISDLETLVRDTHKFESRYEDRLVGPYPECANIYRERSPINYVTKVSCPMILFQGLEDKVVPPEQSSRFYEAVKAKGLPTAYIAFEGEQHGFRKAESVKRSIEAELYFYSKIFGFEPADKIDQVHIENMV